MTMGCFLGPGYIWRWLLIPLLLLGSTGVRAQVVAKFSFPDTVCLGSPITLINQSTGATTYNWNFCQEYADTLGQNIFGCPGYTIPSSTQAAPPVYSYSVPGTYAACLVVDSNLPTQQRMCGNIVVRRAPQIAFGPDTFFCSGQSVALAGPDTPGVTNTWSTGSDSNSIIVTSPGTYTLQSQFYGCTATQSTIVSEYATPSIQLPRDTVFCDSGVLRYTTNQPATFIWNTGSTADSAVVKSNGLYWLQLNERGCTALDSITCKVIPTHSLYLGKDTTYCGAGRLSYVDTDTTNVAYQWSTGSDSTSTPVPVTGSYWLAVTDNGCVARDTINITVVPMPILSIPGDTTFCDSGVLSLAPVPGVTYAWSTGSDSSAIVVHNNGSFKVTVSNAACTASSSTQCTVAATPKLTMASHDTTFCGSGNPPYGTTLPVTSYNWNTGPPGSPVTVSNGPALTVQQSGLYRVILSNQGCTATDSVQCTVIPLPQATLRDTAVCFSGPYVLDAGNPGDTFLWQDGSTRETFIITQPGTFTVTVSGGGCSLTETAKVTAAGVPQFTLGGNQPICPGESLTLRPGVDTLVYTWQDGSNDSAFTVSAPGTYYVTGTNNCGSHTDSVQIIPGVCTVHVPSAFTPNGDGINDLFRVLGVEVVDEFSLRIFNRWGQQVFFSEDKDKGWDGTSGGKLMPVGAYTYTMRFRYKLTGQAYSMQGTVTLIR